VKREVIELVRVTSPDDMANGIKFKREVTVALQMESARVISPENIANCVRI
jgi:hypothetical protein